MFVQTARHQGFGACGLTGLSSPERHDSWLRMSIKAHETWIEAFMALPQILACPLLLICSGAFSGCHGCDKVSSLPQIMSLRAQESAFCPT
jgi:hypothetical protein